jgi:hypothetical protein
MADSANGSELITNSRMRKVMEEAPGSVLPLSLVELEYSVKNEHYGVLFFFTVCSAT